MEARIRDGVRLRKDVFGGICYVPHRDDFFAATSPVFSLLQALSTNWTTVAPNQVKGVSALAKIGVCETRRPATREVAYSGPSFLGAFQEIPSVRDPLVLNSFATAHCPLKCVYCHADDLMQAFREAEADEEIDNVVATVSMIPAMVVVITGGDPLTRPDRACRLIERIAGQKSLVLDTSGVGDPEKLIPHLKSYGVHVRVSLDAISDSNDKARPANREYVGEKLTSRLGAERMIDRCLEEGIPITVQSVVSRVNDNRSEWEALRWWLIEKGVKHWVIHVAVKGGSARRIENEQARKPRGVGILAGPAVYEHLNALIQDTIDQNLPIDVRCTDTGSTPNSVLLVNNRGSLFTEGLAHNGKVELFNVESGRADTVRSLWAHVDEFGHARRYLNWNPWRYAGESLETLCYSVPLARDTSASSPTAIVETEGKYRVADTKKVVERLERMGFALKTSRLERDEYFDTAEKSLEKLDFVVRLRKQNDGLHVALKGPRFFTADKANSRIELELECTDEDAIRLQIQDMGLRRTWIFEKRRQLFKSTATPDCKVVLDEVPEIGYFLEIEGPIEQMRAIREKFGSALGAAEAKNYAEVYRDFMASKGMSREEIAGAEFSTPE